MGLAGLGWAAGMSVTVPAPSWIVWLMKGALDGPSGSLGLALATLQGYPGQAVELL